jgi:flavin-binding protein dodecin
MEGNVFKQIELTGTSKTSIEDAIQTAVALAAKTVHNMCWFAITETRGAIKDGKVVEWQVTAKIGFKIEG